ncbi:hypothetical protein ISG33_15825 [Glaciecola sp. MH2013]|uniref:hypothetical protein n=1 Tax=Glaciecola sp. MH2013 TaxID=2785524 RepID=UPI0018A11949|nr:hypothetical protein [Glaciecola sp. MH2013]MBF7074871.1 hypothetical protein [Glaciecola sp. MH2013]
MKFKKLISTILLIAGCGAAQAAFITNDDIDSIIITVPESYELSNVGIAGSFLFDEDIGRQRGISGDIDTIFRLSQIEGLSDAEKVPISATNSLIIDVLLNRIVDIRSFSLFNDAKTNSNEEISELELTLFGGVETLFTQLFTNLSASHREGRFDEMVLLGGSTFIGGVDRLTFVISGIEREGEAELREFQLSIQEVSAPAVLSLLLIAGLIAIRKRK